MEKKILLTISLLVVVSAIGYFGYQKSIPSSNDPNQPQISITPIEHNFGTINYGQTVEKTFQITDVGQKELKILSVSTSCGCTTAKITRQIIQPGEKIELSVSYQTDAMTGAHAKGDQERRIFIKSNDPDNPLAIVQIKAKVL